jgi:hypothetical protein
VGVEAHHVPDIFTCASQTTSIVFRETPVVGENGRNHNSAVGVNHTHPHLTISAVNKLRYKAAKLLVNAAFYHDARGLYLCTVEKCLHMSGQNLQFCESGCHTGNLTVRVNVE